MWATCEASGVEFNVGSRWSQGARSREGAPAARATARAKELQVELVKYDLGFRV